MREVALTYRRVGRAGKAAGLSPPDYEEQATDAALAAHTCGSILMRRRIG
jgi:hypothetical protein